MAERPACLERQLRVAIDFGTTWTTSAFCYLEFDPTAGDGDNTALVRESQIRWVKFDEQYDPPGISSHCAFFTAENDAQRRLHMGQTLTDALNDDEEKVGFEDVLRFVKLSCFDYAEPHKCGGANDVVHRLREQIKTRAFTETTADGAPVFLSIEQVLSRVLARVWESVSASVDEEARNHDDSDLLLRCPMLLRMAVPPTFNKEQIEMIRRAATSILKEEHERRKISIELVTEPIAALNGLLVTHDLERMFGVSGLSAVPFWLI